LSQRRIKLALEDIEQGLGRGHALRRGITRAQQGAILLGRVHPAHAHPFIAARSDAQLRRRARRQFDGVLTVSGPRRSTRTRMVRPVFRSVTSA
jgi:hypothetical protein